MTAEQKETMQRLAREDANEYEMVAKEPKLVVRQGESFVVETEDALNGVIRRDDQLITAETLGEDRLRAVEFNPCGGPIFVEGAKPGDVLAVHIEDIVVADQGVTALLQLWGPFKDSYAYGDCRGPYTRIIKHLPGPSGTTSDGIGVFDDNTTWDLKPHIGTIGTAPFRPIAAGAHTALGNGPHGGNMDSRDVCKGSIVHLPVDHEGACLYVGDVHASMADAEFSGLADESRADLTLRCEVIPQKQIPSVRVETPDSIIQIHCYRPLDEAVRQAFFWLVDWLVEDYGFSQRDAGLHMGANPDVRIHIYQMVILGRINFTVGVSIPKKYLR